MQHHFQIQVGIAQTVDGRYRSHHDNIATLEQRLGGGQTHLVDVFIHRGIFFDKGIGAGNVGFRLVVIVVGDKVLHRVFREERFHFTVQLRRQGFIRCQYHGWTLEVCNDVSHGKGLP